METGLHTIDAAGMTYRELNRQVRQAVANGSTRFVLRNVRGQRFIADGLQGSHITIEIHGIPGGDLAAFMDGPTVHVYGNGQDAVGNTMNEGHIFIHGNAGDALGYGMRGGDLFVRGNAGYRVGIHMKAYKGQSPSIIIGGCVGDFFGEYMAGGLLVALGLGRAAGQRIVGDYLASGIHGGEIYVRATPDELPALKSHALRVADDEAMMRLKPRLQVFAEAFTFDIDEVLSHPFTRITPTSHRPFAAKYAPA